jgi:CRP-like cAMP-binding protein
MKRATVTLENLRRLLATRPLERVASGEVIGRITTTQYLYELVSGCARRFLIKPDGRRAILDFIFPGQFFGDFLEGTHILTTEAVTKLEIRRISRSQLVAAQAKLPQLENDLLEMARRDLRAAQNHVVLLGAPTARARVSTFLLIAAKWNAEEPQRTVDLPMSRQDIADFLGLTIESVSRCLTQFKTAGIITIEAVHKVVLKDISALQHLAGEDEDSDFEL